MTKLEKNEISKNCFKFLPTTKDFKSKLYYSTTTSRPLNPLNLQYQAMLATAKWLKEHGFSLIAVFSDRYLIPCIVTKNKFDKHNKFKEFQMERKERKIYLRKISLKNLSNTAALAEE